MVFFERLRDEVREGRSLRAAVERGWTGPGGRSWSRTPCPSWPPLLLYIFAIGDVKGFAFTLGLTTLIDVVVVFLFTKPMVTLLARTKFFGQGHPCPGWTRPGSGAIALARQQAPGGEPVRRPGARLGRRAAPPRPAQPGPPEGGLMSRLGNIGGRLYRGEVSFDFVGRQKLWYTISGLILVISIAALLFRGLNFSVDFKGGSVFQFKAPARHHQPDRARWSRTRAAATTRSCSRSGSASNANWQVQTGS